MCVDSCVAGVCVWCGCVGEGARWRERVGGVCLRRSVSATAMMDGGNNDGRSLPAVSTLRSLTSRVSRRDTICAEPPIIAYLRPKGTLPCAIYLIPFGSSDGIFVSITYLRPE